MTFLVCITYRIHRVQRCGLLLSMYCKVVCLLVRGWQWLQLDHMQVCTSLQTDNHASTPPLSCLQDGCPSCSVKKFGDLYYYLQRTPTGNDFDCILRNIHVWSRASCVATCFQVETTGKVSTEMYGQLSMLGQSEHHCAPDCIVLPPAISELVVRTFTPV